MSYSETKIKQLSWAAFLALLTSMMTKYNYDQIDPDLKPRDVPQEELYDSYDFIIVGGGISGCVLARRLTEIKKWKVLVIEAGGDDNLLARIPMLHELMWKSELAWNFTTVPQKYICKEDDGVCTIPRGCVLGGTSVLYDMLYIRGNPEAHDKLVSINGIQEWDYKSFLPYYKKVENFTGLNRPYSPNLGYNGPLRIQFPVWRSLFRKSYIPAGQEYGFKYRNYNDKQQANSIDLPYQTLDGFVRHDAARAYIYPVKDRKNLHIIKFSLVIKILFKGKKATGVEYIRDGKKYTVYAKREVLVTAGPFNSPKLLMLSGIGPRKDLQKLGIKCFADLPVCSNLHDTCGTTIAFQVDSEDTMTSGLWKTKQAIEEYTRKHDGPLSSNGIGAVALNGDETKGFPPNVIFKFQTIRWFFYEPQDVPIISIKITLTRPESVGYCALKSSDPYDDLIIDPKYFSVKNDTVRLEEGIKTVFKYMATPTMKEFSPKLFTTDQPKCEGLSRKNYIKCVLKNYVKSHYRPTGATRLGSESDSNTVVLYNLLVKGFNNLRVIGSSSRAPIGSGPTYGVTYAVAEKAADYIKKKYGYKKASTSSSSEGETEEPGYGEELGSGEETEEPGYSEETEEPGYDEETEEPGYGEETEKPGYGEETEKPGYGEETEESGYDEETGKPGYGYGEETEESGYGEDSTEETMEPYETETEETQTRPSNFQLAVDAFDKIVQEMLGKDKAK